MKRYIFIYFTLVAIACINSVRSCPCGFSPEDQRPFFEQYDEKNKPATPEPKEEQ